MNRRRFQILWVLAALGAVLAGGMQAGAQSPARLPVIVSVFNDYPAFQPRASADGSGGRAPRALVFRHNPTGQENSVVILNPAHLDAETLRDALLVLQQPAGAKRNRLVAVGTRRNQRPVPAAAAAVLEAKLAELRAAPVVHNGIQSRAGRSVAIADISPYVAAQ